jgi:hypothetical protein
MDLQPDQIYAHIKSNKLYVLLTTNVKMKINGMWRDAVLYRPFGASEDEPLYTRTLSNFKDSFKLAPDDHEDLDIKLE